MPLKVPYVLVDVDYLGAVLFDLSHVVFNCSSELRVLLLNNDFILFELSLDMSEELLEVLSIVHDQFVDDRLVQLYTWELI